MNRTVESMLRFVHLTSSGLLAGSLGFGGAALFPGWEEELPAERRSEAARTLKAFNAIGPTALASSVALLVGGKRGRLAQLAQKVIVLDSEHYGRVEDAHLGICHMICYAFMENPQLAA